MCGPRASDGRRGSGTSQEAASLAILKREKASKDKARIEERIREITWISCKEWYDHYDQLVANAARPALGQMGGYMDSR